MIKKRLIFTLLVDNNHFQLSRNFSLQKVGDLNWLFNSYHAESILHSIDELVVLNVSRSPETFEQFIKLLKELSKHCYMPVSAGGRVQTLEQARQIFRAGADKVVLNSSLFTNRQLVQDIASTHGRQSIVASIDYRLEDSVPYVYIERGQIKIENSFEETFKYLSSLPVGELYLTSIEQDGTGRGYDIHTLKSVENWVRLPIIASGGVGKFEHLQEGLQIERVTGVSTANLFNFIGDGLQRAREYLHGQGICLANWDYSELSVLADECV